MRLGRLPFFVAAVASAVAVLAGPVGATGSTWYVDGQHGSDSNACTQAAPCASINAAIAKASAFDTVDVLAGTYTGSGTEVVLVDKNLTLSGTNAVIDGQNARRGLVISPSVNATVSGFDIGHGTVPSGPYGGGGVLNQGTLTLDRSTVRASANGGVYTTGPLTVTNTTISGNSTNVTDEGGALGVAGATSVTVSLVNSTLANNTAEGDGGAIKLNVAMPGQGVLDLRNVTISGNHSNGGSGGGIYATTNWRVNVANSIVWGNTSHFPGSENVANVGGTVTNFGYNIATGFTAGLGDQQVDPLLGPLADNGGPTQTMALLPGSPAIDAGTPTGCNDASNANITTDERSEFRDAFCDIGAFEVQPPANDDFGSAQTLTGASGSVSGGTDVASREQGEPEHGGDEGGASVWFTWTAPTTGDYSFDTIGSGFDTLLGIYTGVDVAHLTRLGSNDDRAAGITTSRSCLSATAGQTVRIAIDGWGGDRGAYTLNWGSAGVGSCPIQPPSITGTARVGQQLSVDSGTFVHPAAATFQWLRCQAEFCDPIPGATGATYTVAARDVGMDLIALVTEGGAQSNSAPTAAVAGIAATHATNGRIFWANNTGGPFQLWTALPDGSGARQLAGSPANTFDPVASPDGTRVAFVRAGELMMMNADGSGVVDTGLAGTQPSWSPDASRIVFTHATRGSIDGLDVAGADGSYDVALVRGLPGDFDSFLDPAWSPDGSKIAFTFLDRTTGHYDIGVIAADGRGPIDDVTDTAAEDEHAPAWSPDGSKLVYVQGSFFGGLTKGDLRRVNADGSGDTGLITGTTTADMLQSAVWSPDGTKLLVSRNVGTVGELFTMNPDGTGLSPLVSRPGNDALGSWAAPTTYALSVTTAGSGSGTVTCTPACASTYADGTTVTLTASPGAGSTFDGWSGACAGAGLCTVTMLGARSVTASFGVVPPPPPSGGGGGGGGGGSSGIPPDIHVDVTASAQTPPAVGSDLLWFVTVSSRNLGGSSDVWLDLTLPAGWTYDHSYADRGPGCFGSAQKLTCDVGFINSSASTHVTLWGKVAQAGDLALTASARSMLEPEFDVSDNTVTLTLTTPAPPPAPTPTPAPAPQPPALTGAAVVGSTLHTQTKPGAHYQWQLCTAKACTPIKGATRPALKLVKADAGKSVRVVVTLNGKATASKRLAVRGRAASR